MGYTLMHTRTGVCLLFPSLRAVNEFLATQSNADEWKVM